MRFILVVKSGSRKATASCIQRVGAGASLRLPWRGYIIKLRGHPKGQAYQPRAEKPVGPGLTTLGTVIRAGYATMDDPQPSPYGNRDAGGEGEGEVVRLGGTLPEYSIHEVVRLGGTLPEYSIP
jgi:hypothetical protein